jgi:Tfp pilus assembly PilM family ATPase
VSLATEGDQVSVRLLSLPTPHEHGIEEKLLSGLNLRDSAGHRIGYRVVLEGHGKQESVVLAVALAEQEAVSLLDLFPSGRPAPCSIELSGLAAMSAFLAGPASDHRNKAVAALDIGINSSMFMAFNKNVPMVCQRLDIGTRSILLKVQESLGVNEETARGVVTDGAFDVADVAGEVAGRLLNRIAVSRDFVERREGCRIRALYVSGALETARDLVKQMESSFDVVKWNPLEAAHPSGAGKADESAEPSRLAAAVGLCLATLEPQ